MSVLSLPISPPASPTGSHDRKFSQWLLTQHILVYDADSTILPKGSNVLGLLPKFRAESGLPADPQPISSSAANTPTSMPTIAASL